MSNRETLAAEQQAFRCPVGIQGKTGPAQQLAKLTQTPVHQEKMQLLNLRARSTSHRSWKHRDPTGTHSHAHSHTLRHAHIVLSTHAYPPTHSLLQTNSSRHTVMHSLAPHIHVCTLAYTLTYILGRHVQPHAQACLHTDANTLTYARMHIHLHNHPHTLIHPHSHVHSHTIHAHTSRLSCTLTSKVTYKGATHNLHARMACRQASCLFTNVLACYRC